MRYDTIGLTEAKAEALSEADAAAELRRGVGPLGEGRLALPRGDEAGWAGTKTCDGPPRRLDVMWLVWL